MFRAMVRHLNDLKTIPSIESKVFPDFFHALDTCQRKVPEVTNAYLKLTRQSYY